MGTPFGKTRKEYGVNGPEYRTMAKQAMAKLRERMTEIQFKAWRYRSFECKGDTMEQWEWRMVWLAASLELSFPLECSCSGIPGHEVTCVLCQSIAHVSSIDLVEA